MPGPAPRLLPPSPPMPHRTHLALVHVYHRNINRVKGAHRGPVLAFTPGASACMTQPRPWAHLNHNSTTASPASWLPMHPPARERESVSG
jgi:hypothetical protein